ncbi:MAG: efflux transporter outer membrane subunit, partial [Verrucomicrobiae bacterium]|nr:efflux transporter outer membrane subunit [Verrucomicrobiae bacterium]
ADRHPRAVSGRWWESFRDHDLDSLVSQALADNPDLRATGRRIDQANASLIRAGATLFPQIDGGGDLSRRWNREGRTDDEASLGLSLDWELDAWGRIRSGRSARAEEVEAAKEDWQAARLLLTGAVAETWFELIEQRGQLRLAREQIEVNQTLLDLTRLRFGQGQSSVVDVLQQQEQLESTQALVPDIEARIEELELALETLTGRLPGIRHLPERNDEPAEPPARPKAGYPADLLAERPDLRAQRARIVALDHEVGEAIADCLPRFSIGGSLALAGTPSLDRLIGDAIAGAVGPVFDAGSRKAEVARRRSRVQEEVYRYTSAYLNAVRDVETSLHRERKLAERVRRQEAQLAT